MVLTKHMTTDVMSRMREASSRIDLWIGPLDAALSEEDGSTINPHPPQGQLKAHIASSPSLHVSLLYGDLRGALCIREIRRTQSRHSSLASQKPPEAPAKDQREGRQQGERVVGDEEQERGADYCADHQHHEPSAERLHVFKKHVHYLTLEGPVPPRTAPGRWETPPCAFSLPGSSPRSRINSSSMRSSSR